MGFVLLLLLLLLLDACGMSRGIPPGTARHRTADAQVPPDCSGEHGSDKCYVSNTNVKARLVCVSALLL